MNTRLLEREGSTPEHRLANMNAIGVVSVDFFLEIDLEQGGCLFKSSSDIIMVLNDNDNNNEMLFRQ